MLETQTQKKLGELFCCSWNHANSASNLHPSHNTGRYGVRRPEKGCARFNISRDRCAFRTTTRNNNSRTQRLETLCLMFEERSRVGGLIPHLAVSLHGRFLPLGKGTGHRLVTVMLKDIPWVPGPHAGVFVLV